MRCSAMLLFGVLLMAGCGQATEEDRAALIGLWLPEDGSPHTVEFKVDGEFDFVYGEGYILRLGWELDRKGRVAFKMLDGEVVRRCSYELSGQNLAIDDGSGAECMRSATTPTTLMPQAFRRAE